MLEMVHDILRFIVTVKHVIYGAILNASRESGWRVVSYASRVWGGAPAEIKFDAF